MPLRTMRRWLAVTCVALLGLELAYVIGANAFLNSDWGRGVLNRRPEKLSVKWSSAWTWLPGIVSVRSLELSGSARRAAWQTAVEEGLMVIWLPSLVRKHFWVLGATGSGARVDVDVLPPQTASESRPGPRRRWRVTLNRLLVEPLTSLRVNEHRLSGNGRIRGRARFQVRGPMELDLGEVLYSGARLETGEEVAAESVLLDSSIYVAPFVVGDDAIGDILAGMTGDLEIDAQASGLGFLEAYLGGVPWLGLGGRGDLTIDLSVTDGWLTPGSRLDLVGPTVTAAYFDLEARGEGRVHGRVPEKSGHTELAVELDRFAVVRPEDEASLLEGEGLTMRITNDSTAIDRPADGIALDIALPPAVIPDFSAFAPYVPSASGLELIGGQGTIEANLSYSAVERSGQGSFQLEGEEVAAAFGDVKLRSKVALDGKLADMQLDDGRLDLAGSRLSIEGTELSQGDEIRDQGWWGRMQLPEGTWTRQVGENDPTPGVLDGLVQAQLRDTGPLVALLARHTPKLAWFDGLLTVHDVAASSRVRSQGTDLSLSELQVTGGEKQRLEILGELDLKEKAPSGVFFARWGPLTAAVALEEGERDWKLTGSRKWYLKEAEAYRRDSSTESAVVVEDRAGM